MTVRDLPTVNACLNALSTVFLLGGFAAVKAKKIEVHRALMAGAVASSALFLGCYLVYHYHVGSVKFTGQGWVRPVYFFILISHIILAIVSLPMILRTVYLAWRGRFETHRWWARRTFPLWLYVSVTGIVVYLMLYRGWA